MDERKIPIYAAALTDAGGRHINEDAVYTCQKVAADKVTARGYLYIVADGTGAQEGGQTASGMATSIISEYFYDATSPDIGESLRTAIEAAHVALYELARRVAAWAEMSTTIVAVAVYEGKAYVAHVGDSRAYLIRGEQVRLLTRDHVWLQDDENYGALTRWLGGNRRPSVEVDLAIETLQENDIIVLCSDGLTDVVDGMDIKTVVNQSPPPSAARQLIELANRRGTGDNVSVAVIQYGGKAPVSPRRRWAWIGAGATAFLGLVIALALILSRPEDRGGSGVTPVTLTATLPTSIQVPTDTPVPARVAPFTEETRRPTSTPVPATDTPTPRPTRVVSPTSVSPVVPTATVEVTPSPTPPPPPHPPPPRPTTPPSR